MISNVLNWISGFFQNLFGAALEFIASLFIFVYHAIVKVLTFIFRPIFILIAIIFYFIFKIAEVFVLIFQVLLAVGKLFFSFVLGIFHTLTGFSWTPSTPQHGEWSQHVGQVFAALEPYQLDKIAYILMFAIWVITGMAAIRLLSGRGRA